MAERAPEGPDGLEAYRKKRDPTRTPEPFGEGAGRIPSGAFVVQKHAARRLHYDLRLELDGRLQSWAVPKGPSFDPDVKRLAVKVEDHPLDYVDFEGIIPEGYGAGNMIVWDRGLWRPLEDPRAGFEKGKLLFALDGYKLRGVWTLFKTGKKNAEGHEWLLMKKPDAEAAPSGGRAVPETSILSGLEVDELPDAPVLAEELEEELAEAGAEAMPSRLRDISPMLAESKEAPFDDPEWLFELKYDGFRLLAEKRDGAVELRYRSGRSATRAFPELQVAIEKLPWRHLVLDGEVVVLDREGKPTFNRLQKRVQLERESDLARARWRHPVTFVVFDLLAAEGRDLRPFPLERRRDWLEQLLPEVGPLRFAEAFEAQGRALFDAVRHRGLEGIMAKKKASPYRDRRSEDWLKIRAERTEPFAVVGFTEPKGSRSGFGGLHLAQAVCDPETDAPAWMYRGRVGSGFSTELLDTLSTRLRALERPDPPCPLPDKPLKPSIWVEPEVVVEVTFLTESEEGIIRQSRFRDLLDLTGAELLAAAALPESEDSPVAPRPQIEISNPDKVFYPEAGITKAELVDYHRKIAPWMLPYLKDRPIALARYPDGIHGKSFFQKHAPSFVPAWIRTEPIHGETSNRDRQQFIVDDVDTLIYLVNLGTIPIHAWTSRAQTLMHPDWLVLDLDPKEAPFTDVVTLALSARELCDELGMRSFVKTSGSSGMHVLLPMGARYDHDQVRTLALLLAKLLVERNPTLATIDRSLERRNGKVYIDYVQNGRGRLLAAPYTAREKPEGTVSTPLDWSEVGADLDPTRFTVRTVPERMKARGDCPLRDVLGEGPDLSDVLSRLQG